MLVCIVEIITCPRLSDPQYGNVELSGLTVGSTAAYTCDGGFELAGIRVRQCQPNGQWSGNEPVCESKLIYIISNIYSL